MFNQYEKIFDSPNQWILTKKEQKLFEKTEWIVTEKIHGSNLSIIVFKDNDNIMVQFAKRTKILNDFENFFSYKLIKDKLETSAKRLYNILLKVYDFDSIQIYGELYGGYYNHPDIKNLNMPIQTGISYSPDIQYVAYDIMINKKDSKKYLNYIDTIEFLKESDFDVLKSIFVGKYSEAMFFNPRFESEIYKKFGLPKIKNNFAEGIVVRSSKNILVPIKNGVVRPLIKIKIPEFKEESMDFKSLSYDEMINNCINNNRINAYISKVGKIENIDIALEDIFLDILETCLSNENFDIYWKNSNEENKCRIKYEIFEKIEKYFKF